MLHDGWRERVVVVVLGIASKHGKGSVDTILYELNLDIKYRKL